MGREPITGIIGLQLTGTCLFDLSEIYADLPGSLNWAAPILIARAPIIPIPVHCLIFTMTTVR